MSRDSRETTPMSSTGAPLCVVCERTGRWAAALRAEAPGAPLRETRSFAHAWEALAERPASFLVVELRGENADAALERLARLEREFPLARAAIVAERGMEDHEGLFREAGAVWFVASPREIAPIAAVALRHLEAAPTPRRGLAERLWASLPWAGARAASPSNHEPSDVHDA